MLMRIDPFVGLDRLFTQAREGRSTTMPLDAYRKGDEFYVEVDLPGVKPESIDVTVEKNVLTVKAERHWNEEETEAVLCERPQGAFTRQLFLGESLDAEHLQACYQDGVLELRIPVTAAAKPRRIQVTSVSTPEPIATSAS